MPARMKAGRGPSPKPGMEPVDPSCEAAIAALRANRPLRAEEICRDYLLEHPGSVAHLSLLGHALVKQNRLEEAEQQVRFALGLAPRHPQLYEDLGSILALRGDPAAAIPLFEQAIRLEPNLPLAHKKLGQALVASGRGAEADSAFRDWFERNPGVGVVATAAEQLREGKAAEAREALLAVLRQQPDNIDAMVFLAMACQKLGKYPEDAEALLRRALQMAPDHIVAALDLGNLLIGRNRHAEAESVLQEAIRMDARHAGAWALLGSARAGIGKVEAAATAYRRSLELQAGQPGTQMGLGHVLKTLGDQPGALAAYREAIRLRPRSGEVYWSMANLKVFRFQADEITAMQEQLERTDLNEAERVHFHFALGKALSDLGDHDAAFAHYDQGNRLQRADVYHDPLAYAAKQKAIREVFSAEFLRANEGHGDPASDPVFIVGLPRSGSTLLEQVLASHSQVEGTAELPNLGRLTNMLSRYRPDDQQFPEACRLLRKRDWAPLGRQYLEETASQRVTGRPRFTDKLPNNFSLLGFGHLILPDAVVINTLRHPLDVLLGNYQQLYGRGQHFTYDMQELADYYREYHLTMQHWREVLPGKVLDVWYEDVVADLEGQVRRILTHCGLEFEPACLRFWENERAVRTASSEQVRQPLYAGSVGKWRKYEKHLELWQSELADILAALPARIRDAGLQRGQ